MNSIQNVQLAIQNLEYPASRDAFDAWKRETVEMLVSSNGEHETSPLHARLSPREHQVMTMLLEGRRLKEIASRLEISVKTVTTHRARLLRKLKLEDNLGLYRYGIRTGLITA